MRNSILLFAVAIIGFTACDVVTEPYGPQENFGWNPVYDLPTVFNDTTVTKRRILLEEFTGHKCPNCPEGQDVAKQIHQDHPEDFLVVSIHNSGAFSKPDVSDPVHPYPANFETQTGEDLRIRYQFSAFPGGMLNRSDVDAGAVKVDYKQWSATVNALLADPVYTAPRFKLYLKNTYNNEVDNRTVRVQYKVEALQNVTGNIAIVGYVVENAIASPQTDNRLSPSYVPDYKHNHLLRSGFPGNGSGKTVFTDPVAGDVVDIIDPNDFLITGLEESWVPENINLIVFVYNSDTGEILGVEEMHLIN
jgi:opacity protein-like surface antigen